MSDNVTPITKEATTDTVERISEQDKHILDLMIMQHKLSISAAEKAIAESKASENAYKLGLYQLYVKYGMSVESDAIDEQGLIKRNSVGKKA